MQVRTIQEMCYCILKDIMPYQPLLCQQKVAGFVFLRSQVYKLKPKIEDLVMVFSPSEPFSVSQLEHFGIAAVRKHSNKSCTHSPKQKNYSSCVTRVFGATCQPFCIPVRSPCEFNGTYWTKLFWKLEIYLLNNKKQSLSDVNLLCNKWC